MSITTPFRLTAALVAILSLVACGHPAAGLTKIQEQRVGDYVVTLLGPNGQVKEGDNRLVLEFRRSSDNQLVDVGGVQATSQMPMPGMPHMVGSTTVTQSSTAGRYDVSCRLAMRGEWSSAFTFGDGQKVQFSLKAQ